MGFTEDLRKNVFGELAPSPKWFYFPIMNDAKTRFKYGVILQAPTWGIAISTFYREQNTAVYETDSSMGFPIEIPEDKLPAPEFRNCKLSRETIARLWPEELKP